MVVAVGPQTPPASAHAPAASRDLPAGQPLSFLRRKQSDARTFSRTLDQLLHSSNSRFLFLRAHHPERNNALVTRRLGLKEFPRRFVLRELLRVFRRQLARLIFKRVDSGSLWVA